MDEIKENIIRQVEDDEKILTYKGLSLAMAISIPDGRKFLLEYYEENKGKLDASFLLTGKTAKGIEMKLVSSSKLDEEKSKFSELFSTLIYSVQLKNMLSDKYQLYNVDVDAVETARRTQHRYCQITYKGGVQMSDDEMQKFRTKMRENAGIKTDGSDQNPINSLFAKKTKKRTKVILWKERKWYSHY